MERAGVDPARRADALVAAPVRMTVQQVVRALGLAHAACDVAVRECDRPGVHLESAQRMHDAEAEARGVPAERALVVVVAEDEARILAGEFVDHGLGLDVPQVKQHLGTAIHEQPHRVAGSQRLAVAVREETDAHDRKG